MKPASYVALGLSILGWCGSARADDLRFRAQAGASHAVGGTQASEFGAGGSGSGSVELPATSRLGVQANAGALVLSKGSAPNDASIAPTSTGAAFLGTLGVRVRAYGAERVAGPWIDANVGVAQTASLTRPAVDAHLGWDVRVSRSSRLDIGPYLGYTQIVQPDSELRSSDARILTAGISIGFGAKERPGTPAAPALEKPLPAAAPAPPPEPVAQEAPEAQPEEPVTDVRVFEDRIVLDDIIHFEFDKANIETRSYALVRHIARFLDSHPDLLDISIEGHADEVGSFEYNQTLSEQRAVNMRALLVHFGVDPNRLRVIAHGKSKPKKVTLKPERENRRVEMFVTRVRTEADVVGGGVQGRSAQ